MEMKNRRLGRVLTGIVLTTLLFTSMPEVAMAAETGGTEKTTAETSSEEASSGEASSEKAEESASEAASTEKAAEEASSAEEAASTEEAAEEASSEAVSAEEASMADSEKKAVEYRITYDANLPDDIKAENMPEDRTVSTEATKDEEAAEGSATEENTEIVAQYTVSTKIPSAEGYSFIGWNYDKAGDGKACKSGDVLSISKDITLYAQWDHLDSMERLGSNADGNPYSQTYTDDNGVYHPGNCTWQAWEDALHLWGVSLPQWGWPKDWFSGAIASGYNAVSYYDGLVPPNNSIAVWSNHVAMILSADSAGANVRDGNIKMNGAYQAVYEGWWSWYQLNSGRGNGTIIGFIYPPSAPSAVSVFTASNIRYPGTKQTGKTFTVTGTLTSPGNITTVDMGVKDASGTVRFHYEAAPNSSTFDVHSADAQMLFASLEAGSYTYYIHSKDDRGAGFVIELPFSVNGNSTTDAYLTDTCPTINSASISNLTNTGYDVTVNTSDSDNGVSEVRCPTWTGANGQDDLASPWPLATSNGNGNYSYHVSASDHNNETGAYYTDVYSYDGRGGYAVYSLTLTVPTEKPFPFTDVSTSDWCYSSVNYVYQKGLMGLSGTRFYPENNVTRGEFAAILYRLSGSPSVTNITDNFYDVYSWTENANAIIWASNAGIIYGTSSGGKLTGYFKPNNYINRQDMATIMYRYAKYRGIDVSARKSITGYNDYSSISKYARPYLQWTSAVGILSGSNNYMNPKSNATNSQCASIIRRFSQKVAG